MSDLPTHPRELRERLQGRDPETEAAADLYEGASLGELEHELAAVLRAMARRLPAAELAQRLAAAALTLAKAGDR